jgi:hypothetical protein
VTTAGARPTAPSASIVSDQPQIARRDRGTPVDEAGDMLLAAAVELDTAIIEVWTGGDRPRDRDRLCRIGDPGAMEARIDIDQDAQPRAIRHDRRERHDDIGMIDHHRQIDPGAHERDRARQHRRRDDRRGDQDRRDRGRKLLGLVQRRAADADCSRRNLPRGDLAAFVGLGVRAQREPVGRGERGHVVDIAIEPVEIENEAGCSGQDRHGSPASTVVDRARRPIATETRCHGGGSGATASRLRVLRAIAERSPRPGGLPIETERNAR